MDIRRAFFIAILLPILLACAVPGFSTPAPKPTTDNRLQVMVEETVAAALTQTAQAVPPTLTPTFTPEPAATPTALPPVGSSLTKQADGSTLFMDERAGYKITIPEGWLAVRVKEQEFVEALTFTETADPLVQGALSSVENEDPGVLRLFAVDVQEDTVQGEPVTTIKFIWDEKQNIAFSSDKDLQALADELPKTVDGLEVTSVDIVITPAKMQFGVIESETTLSDGVMLIQKRVFFKAKNGTMSIVLTTGENSKEDVIPAFDAIMDTAKLLEQ